MTIQTIQNGSHRLPGYFEWWYFHFATESGVTLNMVLHETDIFGLKQSPYLSLSLLLPGQQPRYWKQPLQEQQISRRQQYLSVTPGLIQETESAICFDIPFPDQGYFRGQLIKRAHPLIIQDGILHQDDSGQRSHWVVQVPHANFTALLHLEGQTHRLKGTAYQDHQWGTLRIQEFVSDWVWGHFSNEEMAMVFFQILTQSGRAIERVGLLMENGRFSGSRLHSNYLNTLFQDTAPETFNDTMNVAFFEQQAQLSFEVTPDRLMRSRLNETVNQQNASYLRWSAVGSYSAGRNSQPVYGITEYIRIRPVYGKLHP